MPLIYSADSLVPPGVQPVPVPKQHAPEHGVVMPTNDAKALVAYLLSLKKTVLPEARAAESAPAAPATAPAAEAGTSGAAAVFNAAQGAQLYAANCDSCYGPNGAGVPDVFPSLVGDPTVDAADPTEHIATVMHGAQGRTIKGVKYPAEMPSFAAQLTDAQIADIVGHERTSWGNKAPTVTAAQVAAVRAKK